MPHFMTRKDTSPTGRLATADALFGKNDRDDYLDGGDSMILTGLDDALGWQDLLL